MGKGVVPGLGKEVGTRCGEEGGGRAGGRAGGRRGVRNRSGQVWGTEGSNRKAKLFPFPAATGNAKYPRLGCERRPRGGREEERAAESVPTHC